MITCPPFFRPHKNDLGLTKFTKPLLEQIEARENQKPEVENVIVLFCGQRT